MFKNILLSKEASVATLTINRPEVRNALDQDTRRELLVVLESLPADPSIRVLVITVAGDRAFAAGADIRGFVGTSTTEVVDRSYAMGSLGLFKKLAELDLPTIAAINGYALGGGCELAMCCDIRIAAENARLGQPEINIGIMPGAGGTQRLPRLIG
ncbi:MAG: enoyl-CoA hydratase/isomerase family protein, partial [Chloroflexi bacterium]|nr:enoyl-CoA hydratase/isomerase family protein [Chloroflexota bacterium]